VSGICRVIVGASGSPGPLLPDPRPVPVLAIPPPTLAQEMSHGLLGWMFWRRPLTLDQVLGDEDSAAA
jgi:hypothetical protein